MTSFLRLLTRRSVQIVLLLALLGFTVFLRLQDPPVIGRLRHITFDYYNKVMPRKAFDDVMIVDIDEESIRSAGQWPWPRPLVAKLPAILREMGAKAVAFDIVFSEPDRTSPPRVAQGLPATPDMRPVADALKSLPDNDAVFARGIAAAGNVVTAFVVANQPTGMQPLAKAKILNTGLDPDPLRFVAAYPHFTVTLPEITQAAAGNGSFSMTPESDGVVRRVPLFIGQKGEEGRAGAIYPALATEAIRVALGKEIYQVKSFGKPSGGRIGIQDVTVGGYRIPTDKQGNIMVYYAGARPHLYVPAWRVLSRQVPPDTFKDKIVLIGTSAIGLLDLRSSPLNAVLPGVEIHAEIIEQVLHGQFLQRPESFEGAEIVVTAAVSLLVIFIAPFVGAGWLAALVALIIGGGSAFALYAYQQYGWLIAPAYPALTITVIFITSSILSNLRTEMEKRAVRTAFSHYISPALMEELAANPDKLKLGGEVRDLSVMFTDIRNFTAIAEQMDPAELIRMMNDFLTPMTSCVLESRGTVDKYMGDAMMAFWNAPLDDPDHARHACRAALDMLAALGPVNAALKVSLKDRYRELKAGIGINTGRCSVGNMGSKQRFAYSALGDTVNLASRLEGQTKGYGVSILISDSTRRAAPDFAAIEVDLLTVKGRTEPERVHALLGGPEMAQTPEFKTFAETHARLLAAYRARGWDEALKLGKDCAALRPDLGGLYALYAERIAAYKAAPPPDGWSGVWVAKDK